MRTPDAELSSSAYFGTRSISINGDLPGLSNRVLGYIGSYQNKILRSAVGVFSAGGSAFANQVKPAAEIIPPAIMLPIISAIFFISLNLGYWLTLISCNKERLPCWTKLNATLSPVLISLIFVCGVMVKRMVISGQFTAAIGS